MADKYDIPELGVLAEVRFKEQVVQYPTSDIPDVVEIVLTIAPSWSGLYDALFDICRASLEGLMKDVCFLRVLNKHPDSGNLLFQKNYARLLIRSRLEMIDLKIEKEDHARTKKWLRDTEELLIKNKLYDRNRSVIFKAMEV